MSDFQMLQLKSLINCSLDIGRRRLTRQDIGFALNEDGGLAKIVLRQWQTRGWIHILSELSGADPTQECFEIRNYIDNDRPWSDPLSGRM
jgi:hypothetical protein